MKQRQLSDAVVKALRCRRCRSHAASHAEDGVRWTTIYHTPQCLFHFALQRALRADRTGRSRPVRQPVGSGCAGHRVIVGQPASQAPDYGQPEVTETKRCDSK